MIIKQNQSSTSIPWDMITDDSSQLTPPPQKRIKSVELYKRQHGLSDNQLMVRDHLTVSIQQHALRRDRDKSKESRERDRSVEMKDSLLSQALEGGPTLTVTPQVRFFIFVSFGNFKILYLAPRLAIPPNTKHWRRFKQQRYSGFRYRRCKWRFKWISRSLANTNVP